MSDQSAYKAGEQSGGLDIEVERLRRQALMSWDKEVRTLEWLGLRDGMNILELGPGPGFVTEQLLSRYPSSRVTGIEVDPVLIERANNYLRGKGGDRATMVEGSVMAMPMPDNTFDFAFGRLIFQHLPDPQGAAKEVLRVLKPGGKLVIMDIDEKSHIFEPKAPPELEAISQRYLDEHASKGGNRHIGHVLPRILGKAGFTNLDLEMVVAHSDVIGLEAMDQRPDPEAWKRDLDAGEISQEEFEIMVKFDEVFFNSEPLVMLILYMASGQKPE
jgi:ubiquinone/menaquinone biosynthesis C-methylase UbiE